MKLMAKFNLILLVIFATGGLLISHLAYAYLNGNAQHQVMEQAKLMMASAKAVREYTSDELSPLLMQNPRHRVHFLAETIPFYGANTTFNKMRKSYPDFTYKEAALNPTNLEDRPADWQSDIIYELRNHPGESETSGVRPTAMGPSLYIASPIKVSHECLECHSVPSAAPHAMLTVYGSANGFGWKLDEIVGAQIVSIPMSVPVAEADRAYDQLLLYLVFMLVLAILALDTGVYWFVIRPLRIVSDAADRASRGEKDVPPVRIEGSDEIASVASAFNRMQVSLSKALRMFEEE